METKIKARKLNNITFDNDINSYLEDSMEKSKINEKKIIKFRSYFQNTPLQSQILKRKMKKDRAKRNIIPNTIDRIKELNISKSNRHLADFSMHNEDQNIRNEVTRMYIALPELKFKDFTPKTHESKSLVKQLREKLSKNEKDFEKYKLLKLNQNITDSRNKANVKQKLDKDLLSAYGKKVHHRQSTINRDHVHLPDITRKDERFENDFEIVESKEKQVVRWKECRFSSVPRNLSKGTKDEKDLKALHIQDEDKINTLRNSSVHNSDEDEELVGKNLSDKAKQEDGQNSVSFLENLTLSSESKTKDILTKIFSKNYYSKQNTITERTDNDKRKERIMLEIDEVISNQLTSKNNSKRMNKKNFGGLKHFKSNILTTKSSRTINENGVVKFIRDKNLK